MTTMTLKPTIASDLRLKPQSRKVLRHLADGSSITPSEAATVYSIWRLAACIFDIRKIGYKVTTERREDAQGHKYARYTMTPTRH